MQKDMLVGFLLQVFTTYYKGLHGDNMLHPSKDKNAEWYKGDTFFTILDELSIQKRDPDGPLRIPVLDKIRDQGLFLTGKIEQGSIRVDYIV